MEIRWCASRPAFDALAADQVAALLARKPAATIALPTGLTPVGLYAELAARAAKSASAESAGSCSVSCKLKPS